MGEPDRDDQQTDIAKARTAAYYDGFVDGIQYMLTQMGAVADQAIRHQIVNSVLPTGPTVPPETRIEQLGLSSRVYHRLKQEGYDTIEQLMDTSDWDPFYVRGIGPKAREEIRERLAQHGYRWHEEPFFIEPPAERPSEPAIPADTPVERLGLSVRAYGCTIREGIRTVADLVQFGDAWADEVRGLGPKTLREIDERLETFGYRRNRKSGASADSSAPRVRQEAALRHLRFGDEGEQS